MKKQLLYILVIGFILSSCTTGPKITKGTAYKSIYEEKPVSVLIMPPINRSTNVDAKEYFHSTLFIPLANAGYYVIPPFLSMEVLKSESAYDSELFIDAPLRKFRDVFGADMALFTIINSWNKTALAQVIVEVEYVIKSTKTNEVLYSRKGTIVYDASVSVNGGGLVGLLASAALSAVNTAATKYTDVAKICNAYTLSDLPVGKYNPVCGNDSTELAGQKEFNANLRSNYVTTY